MSNKLGEDEELTFYIIRPPPPYVGQLHALMEAIDEIRSRLKGREQNVTVPADILKKSFRRCGDSHKNASNTGKAFAFLALYWDTFRCAHRCLGKFLCIIVVSEIHFIETIGFDRFWDIISCGIYCSLPSGQEICSLNHECSFLT